MPSICLYFQVHQPFRVRKFSYFNVGAGEEYFDSDLDSFIMKRVSERCYIPANAILSEILRASQGRFKLAFSITGTAIEQMKLYAPSALESFRDLVAAGGVELLGETYYHSLASLFDEEEFRQQVAIHSAAMAKEFGASPAVFRNTELLYSDAIAASAHATGFCGALVEGSRQLLGWRSPNSPCIAADVPLPLLVKNHRLSDDIAFRFATADNGSPLTAKHFARQLQEQPADTDSVGIFIDYETFGEHINAGLPIFAFLRELPEAIDRVGSWEFRSPSELVSRVVRREPLRCETVTSWADTARDAGAWMGNDMQRSALKRIYACGERIRESRDGELIEVWRKLQTSDHFYYMSTASGADGAVHSYFSPFDTPYDAFIAYMNVLKDLEFRLR